jgi:hypothetical protein
MGNDLFLTLKSIIICRIVDYIVTKIVKHLLMLYLTRMMRTIYEIIKPKSISTKADSKSLHTIILL